MGAGVCLLPVILFFPFLADSSLFPTRSVIWNL